MRLPQLLAFNLNMKNILLFLSNFNELNPVQSSLSTLSTAYFGITLLRRPFYKLQILFSNGPPPRSTSGFMRLPQLLAFDTSRHQFGGGRALRTTLYQIPMRPSQIGIWPNVSHFA